MYYVYMLCCEDGSHYTGLCTDPARRFKEHALRLASCARYTRSHRPVRLDALWQTETRSDAARLEALIKRLPRQQKLALIQSPDMPGAFFAGKLDPACYTPVNVSPFQRIFSQRQ